MGSVNRKLPSLPSKLLYVRVGLTLGVIPIMQSKILFQDWSPNPS